MIPPDDSFLDLDPIDLFGDEQISDSTDEFPQPLGIDAAEAPWKVYQGRDPWGKLLNFGVFCGLALGVAWVAPKIADAAAESIGHLRRAAGGRSIEDISLDQLGNGIVEWIWK